VLESAAGAVHGAPGPPPPDGGRSATRRGPAPPRRDGEKHVRWALNRRVGAPAWPLATPEGWSVVADTPGNTPRPAPSAAACVSDVGCQQLPIAPPADVDRTRGHPAAVIVRLAVVGAARARCCSAPSPPWL